MIQIIKTWKDFKRQKEQRSLAINYDLGPEEYILYIVSDPFYWACPLSLCRNERIERAQIEAELGSEGLPEKSAELLDLEDFELHYLEAALSL